MRNEKKDEEETSARHDERGKVNPSSPRIWIWVGDPNSSLLSLLPLFLETPRLLPFLLFLCSLDVARGDIWAITATNRQDDLSLIRNIGRGYERGDYGGRRKGSRDDICLPWETRNVLRESDEAGESIVIWEMSVVWKRWAVERDDDRNSFRPVSDALIREHTRANAAMFSSSLISRKSEKGMGRSNAQFQWNASIIIKV